MEVLWLGCIVSLTESRILWEEILNEGLSSSGWPVDMIVEVV